MRALFTVHPSTGHLHPLVPVVRALSDAGHEVVICSAPAFRPEVGAFGLSYGGCLAAEVIGIPHASVAGNAYSAIDSPEIKYFPGNRRLLAEPLARHREELGLPPDPELAMPFWLPAPLLHAARVGRELGPEAGQRPLPAPHQHPGARRGAPRLGRAALRPPHRARQPRDGLQQDPRRAAGDRRRARLRARERDRRDRPRPGPRSFRATAGPRAVGGLRSTAVSARALRRLRDPRRFQQRQGVAELGRPDGRDPDQRRPALQRRTLRGPRRCPGAGRPTRGYPRRSATRSERCSPSRATAPMRAASGSG